MGKYTIEIENKLLCSYGSYNRGWIDTQELCNEIGKVLHNTLNDFQSKLQERTDKKLPPTKATQQLIDEMRLFIKQNKVQRGKDEITIFDLITVTTNQWVLTFDLFFSSLNKEDPVKDQHKAPTLLQSERAKTYFTKAIEKGFIERTETGYKSNFETDVLLAYFLELVFCRTDEGKDNGKAFPEKALDTLFNKSRLGGTRSRYMNNKRGKPKGYTIVDELFN